MQSFFQKIFDERRSQCSLNSDNPQIRDAIEFGEKLVLAKLLDSADYKVTDEDMWAAFGGLFGLQPNRPLLEKLIRKGGNVNAVSKMSDTWTMLGWAAIQGNIQFVKFLVSHNVSSHQPVNFKGQTAEEVALEEGNHFVALYLRDYRLSYLQNAQAPVDFLDAIRFNRMNTVEQLLENGQYDEYSVDRYGNDALWVAAGYPVGNKPNYKLVHKLINEYGFDPSILNKKSQVNCLYYWAIIKKDAKLRSLLSASVPSTDDLIITASLDYWLNFWSNEDHFACKSSKHYSGYAVDLDLQYDPTDVDENENDLLWRACGYPIGAPPDYNLVFNLILNHGADPNRPNIQSCYSQLIVWAIEANDDRLVSLLLKSDKFNLYQMATIKGKDPRNIGATDGDIMNRLIRYKPSRRFTGFGFTESFNFLTCSE